jgi:protein transport protein SEC61 subunit gamma-like protein
MDEQQIPMQPQPEQIETHQPEQIEHHHKEKEYKPGKIQRLKSFIGECKRVLSVTKKPNREEFITIVKVSGMGILLIGLIGFLIHFAREGLRYVGF